MGNAMKRYGVVMAGGGGTRFWPLSRKERPKQLLNLSGNELMINETLDRISACVKKENLFVVTNVSQVKLMEQETEGRLSRDHILAEPAARNTSACIGYAAMEIVKKHEDGIMCILPSDHFIKDQAAFAEIISTAMDVAEQTDALVTIGIKPDYAATGYGYIKRQVDSRIKIEDKNIENCYHVVEFEEKPDKLTAESYLRDGGYLWNSGMFVWKASTILAYMKRLLPDVYECLLQIGETMGTAEEEDTLQRVYPLIPKISIDYGIMERADHVLVLQGDFGWNDIGSLDMLSLMKEPDQNGNTGYGETICIDSDHCILYGTDQLVAAIGLKDMIVVQTGDAVLVCPKNRAQDVKLLVEQLKEQGRERYL